MNNDHFYSLVFISHSPQTQTQPHLSTLQIQSVLYLGWKTVIVFFLLALCCVTFNYEVKQHIHTSILRIHFFLLFVSIFSNAFWTVSNISVSHTATRYPNSQSLHMRWMFTVRVLFCRTRNLLITRRNAASSECNENHSARICSPKRAQQVWQFSSISMCFQEILLAESIDA